MNFDIVLGWIVVDSMSKSTDMRNCHLSRGASATRTKSTYIYSSDQILWESRDCADHGERSVIIYKFIVCLWDVPSLCCVTVTYILPVKGNVRNKIVVDRHKFWGRVRLGTLLKCLEQKVKSSRYSPGVTQRVPEGLGSQIFDIRLMKVVRSSALHTGRLYPQEGA